MVTEFLYYREHKFSKLNTIFNPIIPSIPPKGTLNFYNFENKTEEEITSSNRRENREHKQNKSFEIVTAICS